MKPEDSFSQGIIARYTDFSDNISTEAEMLYLRNQGQAAEEPAEEIYETNIRNVTNINQYMTENPVLPLQIDLKFVGKLISGAVEKIAGTYTSTGAMTGHPAVLKTEGKTVAVDEKETKRLSEKLRSAQGAAYPLTAAQAVANTRERASEPPVPYMSGAFSQSGLIFEKNAQLSEKQDAPAAERERIAAEKLHVEQERLVLRETGLTQAASDLERREAGLREERREIEHEREALRQQPAEEPISRETPVARQQSAESTKLQYIENRQEVLTQEFHDYIDQTGHGGPKTDRRPTGKNLNAPATDLVYPEAADYRTPERIFTDEKAESQSGADLRETRLHGKSESGSPEGPRGSRQTSPAAGPANFVYPEAVRQEPDRNLPPERAGRNLRGEPEPPYIGKNGAVRGETSSAAGPEHLLAGKGTEDGQFSEEGGARQEPRLSVPAQVPAVRMPAAPEEPVSFVYPDSAAAGREETTARYGADHPAPEAREDTGFPINSESGAPAEFRSFRQPFSAEEPADLVLPEPQSADPVAREPAAREPAAQESTAPTKIRFPEKAAQREIEKPELRQLSPRGEPETVLKARRLEQEGEPAAPVIVARRAGEEFAPADFVYGQSISEETESRRQSSAKSLLSESDLSEKSVMEDHPIRPRSPGAGETPVSSAGEIKSAANNPATSRGPRAAFQRTAPFEPVRMDFGVPNEEDGMRPGAERQAFSAQRAPASADHNESSPSPETEEEPIKAGPSAVRRAQAPAPAETVLPAAQDDTSPAMPPANPSRQPSARQDSGRASAEAAPAYFPADRLSRQIAAKFRPAAMEQKFRPVWTERQAADPAFTGRIRGIRQMAASTEEPVPAEKILPAAPERVPAEGEDLRPAEGGRMRRPGYSGAPEMVLGNQGFSSGDIESRMAAAGIETKTRQKRKVISQTEEVHEHTVNRAINMPASSGKPQQVSRAAVEEELMSSTSIRKIADKVYQELESRLRSEKIRRGNL